LKFNYGIEKFLDIFLISQSSNEFLDNFKLSAEECVLALVDLVVVHAEDFKVDTGNGLDESLVRGRHLELPEETSADASSGGAGQTDLNN
jgi:hypothetical protein